MIKEYFLNYNEALINDFVLDGHGARLRASLLERRRRGLAHHLRRHGDAVDDRGAAQGRRAVPDGDDEFLATYGDGLTDAPLTNMIDAFQRPASRSHVPLGPPAVQCAPR